MLADAYWLAARSLAALLAKEGSTSTAIPMSSAKASPVARSSPDISTKASSWKHMDDILKHLGNVTALFEEQKGRSDCYGSEVQACRVKRSMRMNAPHCEEVQLAGLCRNESPACVSGI